MKVILVTATLGDGGGGLASAVREWAAALAEAGAEVTIFCLNLAESFGATNPPKHPGVTTIEVPGYIEKRTRLILSPKLSSVLHDYCVSNGCDVLHANGVWSAVTRITARVAKKLAIPLVISPHGHLQPWAMANSRAKKLIAWNLYGRRSLAHAAVVQAASQEEKEALLGMGVKSNIAIVPNIIDSPPPLEDRQNAVPKIALFLSRIHPSKGLMDLVDAWGQLRPRGWRALVVGPDEIGHLSEVRARVRQLSLDNDFEFIGPVAYEDRWKWYKSSDLFVLPTYSENFGVTVGEALMSGIPVITTRAAPWSAIQDSGCGWWIDTGSEALAVALREVILLSDEQRSEMGVRGRDYVTKTYSARSVAKKLLGTYVQANGKRSIEGSLSSTL